MTSTTLASFLLPEGFAPPRPTALLREGSLVAEASRYARRSWHERGARRATPYPLRSVERTPEPVLLVPGFMAGDGTLALMSRSLRRRGMRTYRSHIHANVGCTLDAAAQLEERLESLVLRRESRVHLVGHSLGGMLARGIAVRRPELVAGVITLGSPMLAPGAHHGLLSRSVSVLVRLSSAGVPGLMAEECVGGHCARQSFEESRMPVPPGIDFTTIYSRRDGIVDWRACIDPAAEAVEVSASHVGMALDPQVIDLVAERLRAWSLARAASVLEVDRGVSA